MSKMVQVTYRRTSVLRHVHDERVYDALRAASRRNDIPRRQLGEYAREARRQGWTWALIADALRVSASTARRIAEVSR